MINKYPSEAAHIIELCEKYNEIRESVDVKIIYYAASEYKKAYLLALDTIAAQAQEIKLLKKELKRGE